MEKDFNLADFIKDVEVQEEVVEENLEDIKNGRINGFNPTGGKRVDGRGEIMFVEEAAINNTLEQLLETSDKDGKLGTVLDGFKTEAEHEN